MLWAKSFFSKYSVKNFPTHALTPNLWGNYPCGMDFSRPLAQGLLLPIFCEERVGWSLLWSLPFAFSLPKPSSSFGFGRPLLQHRSKCKCFSELFSTV